MPRLSGRLREVVVYKNRNLGLNLTFSWFNLIIFSYKPYPDTEEQILNQG